ncbi:uncharacterized protein LOC131161604 [Malania oleifera]|uniref:uncharacterized protein LOC131161604 n=1 Tax=Malania oleifera TaxID=397392 RepID=UPI0025AE218E|nr:uncharacterized protein LOC131161604 [Malania oleifera]
MNHFEVQQNAFWACEETRSAFVSDRREPVVCPKPRRVSMLINSPGRPLRCYPSHPAEVCESKAGVELLDMILMKEGNGAGQSMTHMASSPPPFFCGSPPSRSANPLAQDARFGDERFAPLSALPVSSPSGLLSPSSSARMGLCVRTKFGPKPAAVRVEGFDCLNRDHQSSSIPAVA